MAKMPQTSSSTAMLIETGRRVCRLCDREGNGTQKYASIIVKTQNDLEKVMESVHSKTFERIADYDALVHAESQLDEEVRSVFYTCRKHDLNVECDPVLEKVFLGSVFFPIIYAPRERKRDLVTRMIARLGSIAPDGDLPAETTTELETALGKMIEAQEKLEKSIMEESRSKALELLGKKEYVEQYNFLYYNACSDLGRRKANRLFPTLQEKRKTVPEEAGTEEIMSKAA